MGSGVVEALDTSLILWLVLYTSTGWMYAEIIGICILQDVPCLAREHLWYPLCWVHWSPMEIYGKLIVRVLIAVKRSCRVIKVDWIVEWLVANQKNCRMKHRRYKSLELESKVTVAFILAPAAKSLCSRSGLRGHCALARIFTDKNVF